MNDSTSALQAAPAVRDADVGLLNDFMLLTKARLSFLVVVTTFIGYCMASVSHFDWERLFYTLIGTGLVAGAAGAFNQIIEAHVDRLMERTRGRPLPSGRMTRAGAFGLASVMALSGLILLATTTTLVAAYLAAATLLIYLAFYTPMKRRTSFCVTIGAVSGAIPPVIGWTAVDGSMALGAWVLFGILFAWQMPHFLALAWVYRDQYAQAGFVMLSRRDPQGTWAATQSLLYAIALFGITLIPWATGQTGLGYLLGAIACNVPLVGCAVAFLLKRTRLSARILFIASIAYLPLQLCLMVFTKG